MNRIGMDPATWVHVEDVPINKKEVGGLIMLAINASTIRVLCVCSVVLGMPCQCPVGGVPYLRSHIEHLVVDRLPQGEQVKDLL